MTAPVTDLDRSATDAGFGSLVGMTRQAVALHRQSGTLRAGGTFREWLLDYCAHMRPDTSSGGGDEAGLTAARARLAAEQADRVAMENAVSRGELAPRILLEQSTARFARQVVKVLEAIPMQVKRQAGATPKVLEVVRMEIDRARALAAAVSLDDEPEVEEEDAAA